MFALLRTTTTTTAAFFRPHGPTTHTIPFNAISLISLREWGRTNPYIPHKTAFDPFTQYRTAHTALDDDNDDDGYEEKKEAAKFYGEVYTSFDWLVKERVSGPLAVFSGHGERVGGREVLEKMVKGIW